MATTDDAHITSHANGMAMFGPHVVALIDLLGQSSELAKWDFVPTTSAESKMWLQAVQKSVGRVMTWRDDFQEQYDEFQANTDTLRDQQSIGRPAKLRRQFEDYRKTSLHTDHFSDTLIFYSQLQNEHKNLQMSNVIKMIATSGALMLAALNSKMVFRGAIEIGMLTRFPTGDPYGPALAKAHRLESKVADYPRIVVGPGVLSYLDVVERIPSTDAPIRAIQALAGQCRTYLAQDSDGCWIVDYLNNAFANAGGDPAGWYRLQSTGFAFVQAELARFQKERNDTLVHRYERLQGYFSAHGSTLKGT